MPSKQFGGKLTAELLKSYNRSVNWKGDRFHNLELADMHISLRSFPTILRKQLTGRKKREPKTNLPILPFNSNAFLEESASAKAIWYGHSVVLLRMNGKTILIDPMLGDDCSPIAPFATRRYSKNTLDLIDDFPPIDVMLISHDHYDHLDYASIQKLKEKTTSFFVAMGVKRHLVSWGVAEERVHEFDWWDCFELDDLKVTFTPTRHFSGRGLKDRFKSLWGGWVIASSEQRIWFSGDGGYGKHFKEIGERLGPFDLAFMECGQYNDYWKDIHLFPEESVQAAIDAQVRAAIPVHWAAFSLSFQHTWKEPAETFAESAERQNLMAAFPAMGEVVRIAQLPTHRWWNDDM